MYEARRGRWRLAAALAALAALARPFGVLVVVPLAVELALQRRGNSGAWLALPIAAFVAWLGALWRLSGDPLVYVNALASYGRRPALPPRPVTHPPDPPRD